MDADFVKRLPDLGLMMFRSRSMAIMQPAPCDQHHEFRTVSDDNVHFDPFWRDRAWGHHRRPNSMEA